MRVISGSARGRPLKGPRGEGTRPTSDKVKGAIFSMLETLLAALQGGEAEGELPEVQPEAGEEPVGESVWSGLRVLDLYAGTGALGIEALSRGAAWAGLVDHNPGSIRVVRENLRLTGLTDRSTVVGATVLQAVTRPGDYGLTGRWDVVLIDAPYGDPTLEPLLLVLAGSPSLPEGALAMVEHSRRARPAEEYDGLRLVRRRRHGDTEVSIYLRAGESHAT